MAGEDQMRFYDSLQAIDNRKSITTTTSLAKNELYGLIQLHTSTPYTVTLESAAVMKGSTVTLEVVLDASGNGTAVNIVAPGPKPIELALNRVGDLVQLQSNGRRWTVTASYRAETRDIIPLTKVIGATGIELTVSEVAGSWNRVLTSDVITLMGEVSNNETEVSVCYATYELPHDYDEGANVLIEVIHQLAGAGTAVVSTIDLNAYLLATDGTKGSDICATDAATIVKGTWTTTKFTVTGTTLTRGSTVLLKFTSSVLETASSAISAYISRITAIVPRQA